MPAHLTGLSSRTTSSSWRSLAAALGDERFKSYESVHPKATHSANCGVFERRTSGVCNNSVHPRLAEGSTGPAIGAATAPPFADRSSWAGITKGDHIRVHEPTPARNIADVSIESRGRYSPVECGSRRRLHTFAALGEGTSPAFSCRDDTLVGNPHNAGEGPASSIPWHGPEFMRERSVPNWGARTRCPPMATVNRSSGLQTGVGKSYLVPGSGRKARKLHLSLHPPVLAHAGCKCGR